MRILSKVLVVCTILLAGCAHDQDAATNRFLSRELSPSKARKTGTKFPIGMARDPEASPG